MSKSWHLCCANFPFKRKAKKNLRKILWTAAYPKIIKKDVAKRVQDRKDVLAKHLIDNGEPAEKVITLDIVGINLI
jgi:hypothetical protein